MTGYRPGADTNAHRIDGDDQHDAYLALNSCSPLEAYFAVRLIACLSQIESHAEMIMMRNDMSTCAKFQLEMALVQKQVRTPCATRQCES